MSILTEVFILILIHLVVQCLKHLQDNSLKCSSQVLRTVTFPKWRHVYKSTPAVAQVQRGIVGVIT